MRQRRSRSSALVAVTLLSLTVASCALPIVTEAYYARRTTRTSVNGCCRGGHHRDVYVRRDVDIDVDYRHYHPVATAVGVAAAATVTAAAIGTIVHSLPPACSAVIVNGLTYQNCGGVWYQPQYAGPQVTYVVVNPPH
jgi:hypothetical protein